MDEPGKIDPGTITATDLDAGLTATLAAVGTNTAAIGINCGLIAGNTTAIGANTTAISVNSGLIAGNTAGIASNTGRISNLEHSVNDLEGGVAMALATANAPIVFGNGSTNFSFSGGFGVYKSDVAGAIRAAFIPMPNVAITASVAFAGGGQISGGGGVGIAF